MIRVSSSSFNGNEKKYVLDCLNRDWISQGKYVREFEEKFADLCGVRHAIACSAGTAALHLSLLALGVRKDDAVIVPALTYIATANAAKYCGARVYFCDIDPDSWCIDDKDQRRVRREYNKRTGLNVEVVLPVHLYDSLCRNDNFPATHVTVEDAAHAIGSSVDGEKVGSLGTLAAFSLYASKIVACGEGGIVTTDDGNLSGLVKLYRGQGATVAGSYHHSVVGYNYRMTDLQAAIGLAQLERLPEMLSYRREVIDRYRSNLQSESRITLQDGVRASGWIMAILVPDGIDRNSIMSRLMGYDIETRPFFDPIPSLPPYQSSYGVPPVAANVARRGICLPTHTEMTLDDVDYICEKLVEVIQ